MLRKRTYTWTSWKLILLSTSCPRQQRQFNNLLYSEFELSILLILMFQHEVFKRCNEMSIEASMSRLPVYPKSMLWCSFDKFNKSENFTFSMVASFGRREWRRILCKSRRGSVTKTFCLALCSEPLRHHACFLSSSLRFKNYAVKPSFFKK